MSEYLNATEAGELIGMSEDYVTRQCKAGVIKAKKLGNQWRIFLPDLHAFMQAGDQAPATRTRLSARQQRKAS